MRIATLALITLALAAGPGLADAPHVTYGPAGYHAPQGPREDTCQYGFQDDQISSGSTLGMGQQLGIWCPSPGVIDKVGFYCEFVVVYGSLDIVIYDDGVQVGSETVSPAQGLNEFDIADVTVLGDACIMLCPIGDFWAVTGEDLTNAPFGNTYWSNSCECTNEFTSQNLWIWAVTGAGTPVEYTTWGQIKALME